MMSQTSSAEVPVPEGVGPAALSKLGAPLSDRGLPEVGHLFMAPATADRA